ncbi:hypothetical protein STEG23_000092 [Scotinomys teguina]
MPQLSPVLSRCRQQTDTWNGLAKELHVDGPSLTEAESTRGGISADLCKARQKPAGLQTTLISPTVFV